MTECSSVRTTMTTIIGRVTVDLFIEGRGGIKACHNSNLNGEYVNTNFGEGIIWYNWKGFKY